MHLQPDELVDVAEGTRPESSVPHLASCEVCRLQLADLKATISAAADVEVPEPSPLFWDHLSARVRDAVAALDGDLARTWGMRIAVRVGVNTGEVLASNRDSDASLVADETVEAAIRLGQAAGPGDILIGPETERLVRGAARAERLAESESGTNGQ